MINCDTCEGWYHLSCIQLDEKEALELSFRVCRPCKDSHLLVKSLKAHLETLKMKLQTVEHSFASDIDILEKELAILKNAREADMATMMSKEKVGNPGKPHPNQKHDDRTEDPSVGTDRKSIKKRNTNAVEIVEEKTSQPSSRDFSTESSIKENIELQRQNEELKERICIYRRTRNIQPQRGSRNQGNYEKSRHYHNQGKKTSQKQIKEWTCKHILISGDSQLHGIDSSKTSRTHDVKVRSQGGLKLEQLENLRQEIKYNPDEVIVHVGVNNTEFESEEDILDKFANISDSFYDMTKLTFSGIIRRSDKPDLNQKIDSINCQSEKMCLNKGHDSIDNNNIKFSHLK